MNNTIRYLQSNNKKEDICNACGRSRIIKKITIYRESICSKCDGLLRRNGTQYYKSGKRPTGYIERKIEEINNNIFNDPRGDSIYHDNTNPQLNSQIENNIKSNSIAWGSIIFIILLAFLINYMTILVAIPLSIIIPMQLVKSYSRYIIQNKQESIQKELKDNAKIIDKEKAERVARIREEHGKNIENIKKQSPIPIYSREEELIANRLRKNIVRLNEYYLYSYPPDWEYRKELVIKRDRYRCRNCRSRSDLQVHHKEAVQLGGDHFLDNLITLCAVCHLGEHPFIKNKVY